MYRFISRVVGRSSSNQVKDEILSNSRCTIFRWKSDDSPQDYANKEHMQLIQLEMRIIRERGEKAPDSELLTPDQWDTLLKIKSKVGRHREYHYLWQKQIYKKIQRIKADERSNSCDHQKLERTKSIRNENHISYGPYLTTFLPKIEHRTIIDWKNSKLYRAMQTAQNLVIDCRYDSFMSKGEASSTANQIEQVFAFNRKHSHPMSLHLCNFQPQDQTMKVLLRKMPGLQEKAYPLSVHEEDYSTLFPAERLVYLTPYAPKDLNELRPDDIYVLPALTDKSGQPPVSLATAKRSQVRMAKMPLRHYLSQRGGNGEFLPLDILARILLDVRVCGDWSVAMKHLPSRLLDSSRGKGRIKREPSNENAFKFLDIKSLMDDKN